MSLQDSQRTNGMIRFRIREHKTTHLYGPAFMFIPKRFVDLFRHFKIFRHHLIRHQVKFDASVDNEYRVFVDLTGHPDKYLTRRFEQLVHEKFNKHVTIRDCRSLYITYAHEHTTELKDMYELSRLMYHSFATQQQVYRSDTSAQRLVTAENLANRIADLRQSDAIESAAALPVLQMDTREAADLDDEADAQFVREQAAVVSEEFAEFDDDELYLTALERAEAPTEPMDLD